MTADDRSLLQAGWRTHLDLFVRKTFTTLTPGRQYQPNWHIEAMCHQLERIARGEINRLIITLPPRHLKSICTSVAFVAWCLGHQPHRQFLVASYGEALAAKHARDCRKILEQAWFRATFPTLRLDPRKNTDAEVLTTQGGGRRIGTPSGPATGFGADVLIIDDLMKAIDAHSPSELDRCWRFYSETLYSRLNDGERSAIVVIQQRLHEADLVGHLLEVGGFEHLNLPAIAVKDETFDLPRGRHHTRRRDDLLCPERQSREELESLRSRNGATIFEAQYQQNPTPPGGNLVRWDSFPTYDPSLARDDYIYVVQSWDTASALGPLSDFSVCITLGLYEGRWHMLDVYRGRLEYPALRDMVVAQQRRWRADCVIVEESGVGRALVTDLPGEISRKVGRYKPQLSKEARLRIQSGKIEDKLVWVPQEAPWLDAFRHELLAFPNGKHDDQVDCLSQFLEWADPWFITRLIDRAQHGGRPSGKLRPKGLSLAARGFRPQRRPRHPLLQ
jgi:predicted phage terminase large subunit-like protein